ncbi:MAG TPA: amino acid permease [Candidatus Acidoferrales bacterium]|nr:amino acid permease [Candidatus Acidoferrales bacterium]
MAERAASLKQTAPELVKGLGLFDSTMIVVGSMIGSGIFIVSADISNQVQSPGLLIMVWVMSGVMTLIGALSYGELAAAMPHAGGQYVFLRESFGRLWGFLYGWTMLLVVQTATIAAVAIAFAKFTGVFMPWFSPTAWILKFGTFGPWKFSFGVLGPYELGLNRQNLLAILSIVLLTWINLRGLRLGKIVQNVFTSVKIVTLAALVIIGIIFSRAESIAANFHNFWRNAGLSVQHAYPPGVGTWEVATATVVGVAMVGALFSSDAWYDITFTAAEVKRPERNLPLSLFLGTVIVTTLYVLTNFAYLRILPMAGDPNGTSILSRGIQFATDGRVATAALQVIFGPIGAVIMALAILISCFGCNNGLILAGARIYYAMAKDGLLFRSIGRVNRHSVPGVALILQCAWASILCLSGTYNQLLDFLIFAELIFYILTLVAIFVLRRTRPTMERPYRAFGYPVLPAIYIAMALFLEVQLLRYKPQNTWPGLIIVLVGLPVYLVWQLVTRNRTASATE